MGGAATAVSNVAKDTGKLAVETVKETGKFIAEPVVNIAKGENVGDALLDASLMGATMGGSAIIEGAQRGSENIIKEETNKANAAAAAQLSEQEKRAQAAADTLKKQQEMDEEKRRNEAIQAYFKRRAKVSGLPLLSTGNLDRTRSLFDR